MYSELEEGDINDFSASFESDPKNRLSMNAVTQTDVNEAALNRDVVNNIDHTYSELIKTGKATSQGRTGRCWIFAGLNTLRIYAMKKLNLEDFELSQPYIMFWDKLEKANYFLENIIETRGEALDSRIVMWLLANITPDAGQWDMFVNLIRKYGVIPKKFMPETKSSMESRSMNGRLVEMLREHARDLREMNDQGAKVEDMRAEKRRMLEGIYRMLRIHLGTPPSSFYWEWRDKDDEFHRHGLITPQDFLEEYIEFDLESMVCLINAPTEDKPFYRMYTVQYLGNVVGGHGVRYLNVPIEVMKTAAVEMIRDGCPVWFGADAGKRRHRDLGVFDTQLYDYKTLYGARFGLDKADRLDYGQSRMTHAMVFTGVDLDEDGNPRRWRVENSWGDEIGDEGFYTMSDGWFNEYVYEVMVERVYLSSRLIEVLGTEPTVLKPWDPMGALAR
ncbi:MAG: aminopeptidase C [Candidatus Bathyarchaeia archaeon]